MMRQPDLRFLASVKADRESTLLHQILWQRTMGPRFRGDDIQLLVHYPKINRSWGGVESALARRCGLRAIPAPGDFSSAETRG